MNYFRLGFLNILVLLVYFHFPISAETSAAKHKFCDIHDLFRINICYNNDDNVPLIVPAPNNSGKNVPNHNNKNVTNKNNTQRPLYIIYDVHQVEGFNLRRDVYIRMATFIWSLRQKSKYKDAKLVLPPFMNMYHWRSQNIDQARVFWGDLFDLESLRKFTEVLDFPEFFEELGKFNMNSNKTYIDQVYKLQNFDEMFENGVFRDKFEKAPCKNDDERRKGFYFGYKNLTHRTFTCVNFQGGAKMLQKMLYKYKTEPSNSEMKGNDVMISEIDNHPRIVLVLRSETVLHDFWSTAVYWKARRSLRFSKALTAIADKFRQDFLNSTNDGDLVQRPEDWRDEKPYRGAKGGDYLAIHLRRADFLYGREKTVPSLQSAAAQIKTKLKELNLGVVFIASDCTGNEFNDLKNYLKPYRVIKYKPESKAQFDQLKDGGVAIIDQIICSHARYFIGTYESTFTFRIYEEREILGFEQHLTYNTLCKREDLINCEKNTPWTIIY
uniref:GDP-fucose protein O-fucosyltransferase 2 n=1 Tax=Culicoides sonorensis TaxID=179676 RepID=A0A336MYC3_CULSO